ncbi:hypothetical protein SORBI_3009G110300 [Sorghum bicolor]|uniref:protein-serine/threonine phosphatase n=1 Tax=Sorghum bicolor TaxID=4558 RepID=A0A1Z5R229_SORBI|nr:hypothetical protein SORBI_3009G110300 [Sorghum bicolor]
MPSPELVVTCFTKRGEGYLLIKPDCLRVPRDPASAFSVFAVFDGHNGVLAAVYSKEHLLEHVMSALLPNIGREDRLVGDSRCILDTQGGELQLLTMDHSLEENAEERERVTASGGEVGRLKVGPLWCWPGGLCLSRSIGDMDVGEFIVPIPHVKQVKLSNTGGRLIIASDGIWDALSNEAAAQACRGLPAELAAKLVVKQALKTSGLKDDTTCVVVDITPSDHLTSPQLSPKKNQNKLKSLFHRRSHTSVGKLGGKSASIGSVEELFEESSAMLEERAILVKKRVNLDLSNSQIFS